MPHLKDLRIAHIIDFIIFKCDGECYLHGNYLKHSLNRSWLCNIGIVINITYLYCKHSGSRRFWFIYQEHHGEEHFLEKKNLVVKMDLKVAKIFRESKNVSGLIINSFVNIVEKGKSHKLLRKAMIKDEKIIKEEIQSHLKDVVKTNSVLKSEKRNFTER